ncbi:MAG: hypothetical protein EAZ55_03920 [Cytophagales bacterium]|nr:MAG: hypothetical protein EAZ55_03920 [Cytophagales bacterium]
MQYLPEQYLAHLYQIIQLMASPFKETKTVDKETLQVYVNFFRQSFELIMQEGLHLTAHYRLSEEKGIVLIQWVETQEKNTELSEIMEDIDLLTLVKENKQEYEAFIENIQTNTQIFFSEKNIIFCKTTKMTQWTEEQAQTDSRDLFGILIQNMPQYKTETYGIS